MSVDSTDGTPDIALELSSSSVYHVPEVDLIGEFWKGGQKSIDGGVETGGSHILNSKVNHWRCVS